MRRTTHLHTYGRRSSRLHERKSARARGAVVFLVVAAVLAGSAFAFAAIRDGVSPAGREPSAGSVVQTAAAPSAMPGSSAAPEASASPKAVAPASDTVQTPSRPATITVAGVGDMLFDRNVKELIKREGGKAPLAEVADRLAAADVAVGNLETTLAESGSRNPVKEPKYAFRGHPDGIEGLRLAGFDAVSLANNHALDYGWDPLRDTILSLRRAGIGHAGAGKNTEAAWAPATIVRPDGTRVAYLAFTHIVPAGFLAQSDRPGVASGKTDMGMIEDAVRSAKRTHDYVIVSFHWGVEYEDHANGDQVKKAHRVVDAGADMVLAHHPHVIQGVEFYKNRLIAYSLGDFVFDHYSRKTGEAFILEAELGPDGTTSATAVPVYLDEYGRPEFVRGDHAEEILGRLKDISKRHGTTVEIDGHLGRLTQ